MNKIAFIIVICLGAVFTSNAQITLDSTVLDTNTIVTGLDVPWEIQWGPDDWIWVTERYGRISRIDPNTGIQRVLLDLSDTVHQTGESGLLGMVLHPNFADTPQVFLVYTYRDPTNNFKERLVRYEYDATTFTLQTPFVLMDNILAGYIHDGARLLILPDRTLLMTTGDVGNQALAQNINSPNGKTLRLNLDGSIPADNPIPGSPVWSWGHRNAQGLYRGPNGIIYSSEHGPSTNDELNILEKGRNYGWPNVEGYCDLAAEIQFCQDSNVKVPIHAWTPTVATSDIVWYNHPAIPEFQNSILLTTLKGKKVIQLQLNNTHTEVIRTNDFFTNYWGRLRDVCISPDGRIFLATNGSSWSNPQPFTHSIIELKNINYTNVIAVQDKECYTKVYPNPTQGHSTLEVSNDLVGQPFYVYNSLGQLVLQGNLETKTQLNSASLFKGLYWIHIPNQKQSIALRWMVH